MSALQHEIAQKNVIKMLKKFCLWLGLCLEPDGKHRMLSRTRRWLKYRTAPYIAPQLSLHASFYCRPRNNLWQG